MKLYHIHKPNKYDELYTVGNVIEVGKEENDMRNKYLNSNDKYGKLLRYKISGGLYSYGPDKKIITLDTIDEMTELDKAVLCSHIYGRSFDTMKDIRELMLEEVRSMYYPEFTSRYTCMWLADENSLDYWCDIIHSEGYPVYEMDVSGKLFASTSKLLPWIMDDPNDMYKKAYKYWKPSYEDLKDANDKEYLFEGKAKVLRRVK